MTEKDLIAIFDKDFQNGGDCYDETLVSVNWDSLRATDESDREEGCKVVARLSPSGSGYVWLCFKDDELYTNWETKTATTLIENDNSDYYKELCKKVKEHYPKFLQKDIWLQGVKFEKNPEVVLTIVKGKYTFFGVKYINPRAICYLLQKEIPEFHFGVKYNKNYPFGPCIRVNHNKCKLDMKYNIWLETIKISFTTYK